MAAWDMQGSADAGHPPGPSGTSISASPLMREVMAHLPCGLAVFDAELRLVVHNAEF